MNRIEMGKYAYDEAVKMGANGPIMQDTSEEGKQHAYEMLGEIMEGSQKQMLEAEQSLYLGAYLIYYYMGVCEETDKIVQDILDSARLDAMIEEQKEEYESK